jgi:hypothetical protein
MRRGTKRSRNSVVNRNRVAPADGAFHHSESRLLGSPMVKYLPTKVIGRAGLNGAARRRETRNIKH